MLYWCSMLIKLEGFATLALRLTVSSMRAGVEHCPGTTRHVITTEATATARTFARISNSRNLSAL